MRIGVTPTTVIATLALLAGTSLVANPLKAPHRTVNGQAVNLTPLFHWWTNRSGARPLTAWVHVTGSLVGTNAGAWVLEAKVEHAEGQPKVLLKNPPWTDLSEFQDLAAHVKTLNDERAKIAGTERQTASHAHDVADARKRVRTRGLSAQAKELKLTDDQQKAQLKLLDQQLKEYHAKLAAFPDANKYAVDCLALDTGQKLGGLPVYDHGFGLR
jgi:hypothetical protein